jgi:hypothetical protein
MKVFIVTYDSEYDTVVEQVFLSKDKAKRYIELQGFVANDYEILECESADDSVPDPVGVEKRFIVVEFHRFNATHFKSALNRELAYNFKFYTMRVGVDSLENVSTQSVEVVDKHPHEDHYYEYILKFRRPINPSMKMETLERKYKGFCLQVKATLDKLTSIEGWTEEMVAEWATHWTGNKFLEDLSLLQSKPVKYIKEVTPAPKPEPGYISFGRDIVTYKLADEGADV